MIKNNKNISLFNIKGALIGSAILLALTLPRNSGFIIFLFLFFLIPVSIQSLVIMLRDKNQRKTRGLKLAIWSFAITVSAGYNFYIHTSTRAEANNIVASIEGYKATNGKYPDSIEQIGLSEKGLRQKLGMSGYHNENGKVDFFYGITYIIYDTFDYNFKEKSWKTYNN